MLLRIILSLAFFLSIFLAPWFVTVALALCLLIVSTGYEVLIGGALMDLLYGVPTPAYILSPYLYTILFVALFVVAFYLKRHLVWYSQR